MNTNKILSVIFLVTGSLLFSSNSEAFEMNVTEDHNLEAATVSPEKGKYAIKSGIVVYKTLIMGMAAKQTLTFDDYGKMEVQEVEMDMMGTKLYMVTLSKDGFVYTMDMVKKTGTKSPVSSTNNANIDFENMSEQMAKDMGIKKLGTEAFLGRTCERMSIDYKKMQLKGTYLVYKGVALSIDTDLGTLKMKLVGENFVENPEVPANKFDIPADIVFAQ